MISVIVPIYNAEMYLEECLASIKIQTYKDIEVIMVNDGSTDSSNTICEEFSDEDSRFRMINQKNSGASAARNTGIRESRGDLLFFVDSDDTIDSDCLELLFVALMDYSVDLCRCNRREGYEKKIQNWDTRVFTKSEIFPEYLNGQLLNSVCGVLYKKEIVDGIWFPEERQMMEDAFFTSTVLERCNMVARIGEPKYNYRMNEASLTHSRFSEKIECGYFKNYIEKARIIKRNLSAADSTSMDRLYDYVMKGIPWILGSNSNLELYDIYGSLRTLIEKLSARDYDNKIFQIVLMNHDYRKAQSDFLLYALFDRSYNIKTKIKYYYRFIKRRYLRVILREKRCRI